MDFGQNLNSKFAHSGSTVPFGTLRAPVVVFSMSVNLFLTTYKRRAPTSSEDDSDAEEGRSAGFNLQR